MSTSPSYPAWDASDFHAPMLDWDRMSDVGIPPAHPAVEVPVDVSGLSASATELLRSRLAWRCRLHDVTVRVGEHPAITLVGPDVAAITPAFRAIADAAIASVRADAAAGWSATDEAERFLPFSWG